MKRHILTAVCVVAGLAVVGAMESAISSGKESIPDGIEKDSQASAYQASAFLSVATGVFRSVDLNASEVWVDETFLEKSKEHQRSALWPVYLYAVRCGKSEFFAVVRIYSVKTGDVIGEFSDDRLTML